MVIALAAAIVAVIVFNRRRLPSLRQSMDAGANASVLPALSVASLVGFGAVVAALPAFAIVRDWVLAIEGGPLVSLAVATNVLAALTGSASGGLTIALDALGQTYMAIAAQTGLSPALMHRVAVIGSGTLDILPHNGAVVTLLAVCGMTHGESYFDIVMVGIVERRPGAGRGHSSRLDVRIVLSGKRQCPASNRREPHLRVRTPDLSEQTIDRAGYGFRPPMRNVRNSLISCADEPLRLRRRNRPYSGGSSSSSRFNVMVASSRSSSRSMRRRASSVIWPFCRSR